MDYKKTYEQIKNSLKVYVKESGLKSLVLGVSGGIDSAVVAVIAGEVCRELNIPLIGAWLEIDGNKPDEKKRAIGIGREYCTEFMMADLTNTYMNTIRDMHSPFDSLNNKFKESNTQKKVRLGNVKARIRMIHLYNLAQRYGGATLDTDNKTEYNLGFWTIHGDDFDICLLNDLWKTEVYALANYLLSNVVAGDTNFKACIDAIPTDGLGITNSDVEQFGCKSYDVVDNILQTMMDMGDSNGEEGGYQEFYTQGRVLNLCKVHGVEVVDKVWKRHLNSEYKRNLPIVLY